MWEKEAADRFDMQEEHGLLDIYSVNSSVLVMVTTDSMLDIGTKVLVDNTLKNGDITVDVIVIVVVDGGRVTVVVTASRLCVPPWIAAWTPIAKTAKGLKVFMTYLDD